MKIFNSKGTVAAPWCTPTWIGFDEDVEKS